MNSRIYGQAPGNGRVRAVGVLHNRGARRPPAQRSVRGAGSQAVPCPQGRWPGCHGPTQGRPGRAERARPGPASRPPQGAVTSARHGGTSGPSGSRRWCFAWQCHRRGARFAAGPGRSRGQPAARRARSADGASAPGPVLPATGPAGAAPGACAPAQPAAGPGRRSRAQARPARRAPPGPAPRQQSLQPDRDRDGPGAPPGPAADRPAGPGSGPPRQPVRTGRPAPGWRLRPADPGRCGAAPGCWPWRPRRPKPRRARYRCPARWRPWRPRCGPPSRWWRRWRAAAGRCRWWRRAARWCGRPWPQRHPGRVRAPGRAPGPRPQVTQAAAPGVRQPAGAGDRRRADPAR